MSDGTTDEIKARLNIVDVISGYVKLDKAGVHWKACCPFHQERTPSFMVNEEKNMWHCFGCGKGGDVFAFVMEMEGLDFREALVMLAERAGVELSRYRSEDKGNKEQKDRTLELLELTTKFFEKQLWDGAGKKQCLLYLRERGLTDESIHKFRLGYAPDGWRHLLEFLTGKEYTTQEMENAGLIIRKSSEGDQDSKSKNQDSRFYDRFRDRIMFPILDILGRTIGYSARVAPGGDESQAKYINTPETPIYHKSRALYGLYLAKQAMKQSGATVIVEGNMDVIAMHQAGIENTVAVSGTALTDEQLTLMKRYGNEVRLFFDMDAAGQKASYKSAKTALEKEISVYIVALPFGKDAADMGKDDPKLLKELVEQSVPALQYFLQVSLEKHPRDTAEGKRKIVEEYTELLMAVKNPIERAHWIKELAKAIQMEEKMVIGVVNAAFLEQARRDGPAVPTTRRGGVADTSRLFGSRSDRLREEIVGLMYADRAVRAFVLGLPQGDIARTFLEKHRLFFFLVQAGGGDPLSLIEDTALKSEVARLSFRILERPDVVGAGDEEQPKVMMQLAEEYLQALRNEALTHEALVVLEHQLADARTQGDKQQEKKLLNEFTQLTSGRESAG